MDADQFILSQFPLNPVPPSGKLVRLPGCREFQQRYLVAKDGVWREITASWIRALYPVLQQDKLRLPYGSLTREIKLLVEKDRILRMIRGFTETALQYRDQEIQQNFSLDQDGDISGGDIFFGTDDSVDYRRDRSHTNFFLDIHSHGLTDPFFSSIDNRDDRDEVKVAVVVGNLGGEPQYGMRVCLGYGIFIGGEQCIPVD